MLNRISILLLTKEENIIEEFKNWSLKINPSFEKTAKFCPFLKIINKSSLCCYPLDVSHINRQNIANKDVSKCWESEGSDPSVILSLFVFFCWKCGRAFLSIKRQITIQKDTEKANYSSVFMMIFPVTLQPSNREKTFAFTEQKMSKKLNRVLTVLNHVVTSWFNSKHNLIKRWVTFLIEANSSENKIIKKLSGKNKELEQKSRRYFRKTVHQFSIVCCLRKARKNWF